MAGGRASCPRRGRSSSPGTTCPGWLGCCTRALRSSSGGFLSLGGRPGKVRTTPAPYERPASCRPDREPRQRWRQVARSRAGLTWPGLGLAVPYALISPKYLEGVFSEVREENCNKYCI